MNIVYLTRQLHFDGPKLGGRSLVRHLASENNVRVRGGIVDPASELLKGQLADVLATPADLADVDVVYMEGGWNDPALGETSPGSRYRSRRTTSSAVACS